MKANNSPTDKKLAIKSAIAAVEWQDLQQLTRSQIAYNLILPYPFLLLSWWFQSILVFASMRSFLSVFCCRFSPSS